MPNNKKNNAASTKSKKVANNSLSDSKKKVSTAKKSTKKQQVNSIKNDKLATNKNVSKTSTKKVNIEKNKTKKESKTEKKLIKNSVSKNKNVNKKVDVIKKEKKSFKEKISNLFLSIKNKFKKHDKKNSVIKEKNNSNKKKQKKVNNKTNQLKKEPIFNKKTKRLFIIIAFICLAILLIEGVYLIIHKINIDNNTVYYDTMNSITIDGRDMVAVGSSDFRYSKENSYTKGYEKGKLIKYDKNGKVIFEKIYKKGISNTFSSVISISDGYIVVGSGVFSEQEQLDEAREAFIIKYDKDGKIIWEKFYQVVTDTKFNKVIETKDGYIVIGQSIYANMEMGNHTTGGGIIVKYDKDGNEVWHNNHGGMKSGNFNDIVEVNGSFYVVGKDASDSGNIIKYSKDGKYEWHKNYSYTDRIGFTGIAYLDNNLYVVGSKKILPEDVTEDDNRNTTNTDAIMVVYDLNGNKKFEKTFGGSNYERYNSILSYNNNLYVVGHTSSKDAGFKIVTDGELMTGLVVRYDKDGNILKKEVFGGSNNDNLTDITTDSVSLYISGYSNSGDGNITTSRSNGKDYFGKVIKIDFKFRTLLVK